jgi:hypothetical protein
MELRFVATEAKGAVSARSVPTAALDSCVQLYPALTAPYTGAVWRFV